MDCESDGEVDIFGFFMWTASLSGGEGLLRRRDLVVGVCVNIKSVFNGGVCLFTFLYKPGEPCNYRTCPSQYRSIQVNSNHFVELTNINNILITKS